MATEKLNPPSQIIYVADPMCSWCWGFAPEFSRLRRHLEGKTVFSLLLGGLREGHAWDDTFKNFLYTHWEEVHLKTGQPFHKALLKKTRFNYTTEPACRALCTIRRLEPWHLFEMLEALQSAFYQHGKDITDEETIIRILEKAGMRSEGFRELFTSDTAKKAAAADRTKVRAYGAAAFPSLVTIDKEGHLGVLRGYRTFEELKQLLQV